MLEHHFFSTSIYRHTLLANFSNQLEIILIIGLIFICIVPSFSQKLIETDSGSYTLEDKRVYITQRIQSNPPNIDGNLDDDCWL